jgi:hypothetical protein
MYNSYYEDKKLIWHEKLFELNDYDQISSVLGCKFD